VASSSLSLSSVLGAFSSFAVCGFVGRSGLPVPGWVLLLARSVFALFPAGSSVSVGASAGVPGVASSFFGSRCRVFRPGRFPSVAAGLVRRSCSLVSSAVAAGSLWVSFPVRACPPSLGASSSWVSSGSGSWSSLSLAAGSGCACLVFCPGWGRSVAPWAGFVSVGGGFWFCPAAPPTQKQLSLFQ